MTSSRMVISVTVRAMGPAVSRTLSSGTTPVRDRPIVAESKVMAPADAAETVPVLTTPAAWATWCWTSNQKPAPVESKILMPVPLEVTAYGATDGLPAATASRRPVATVASVSDALCTV